MSMVSSARRSPPLAAMSARSVSSPISGTSPDSTTTRAVVRQQRHGLLHGVAGAQLRLLPRKALRGTGHAAGHGGLDLGRAVAGDDHHVARADARGGVGHMRQQCAAPQSMQHFGQLALHARALAGRHDDDVDRPLVVLLRSLIHAFFFPISLRAVARIIGVLLLVAALGACSAIKLAYNNLPR
jgi:hypothetical protein